MMKPRPLRIVHVSNFSMRPKGAAYSSVSFKLSHGLVRAGHNVFNFSDRDVARASNPFGARKFGVASANNKLLDFCRDFHPDVVLLGHADVIRPPTVADLRRIVPTVRIAQWNVDPLFEDDNVRRIRGKQALVDYTFISTAGPTLSEIGAADGPAAFLPNPVDDSIERGRNFERADLPYDLFYPVGDQNLIREHVGLRTRPSEIVNRIRAKFPKLRGLFPGIGGQPHLFGTPYMDALETVALGLNLSRRNDVYLYSSDRLAHLLGNGVTVLIDRACGYHDLLSEDELVGYSSEDELMELIGAFATDPARRMRVGKQGGQAYRSMFDSRIVAEYLVGVLFQEIDPASYRWRR